MTKYYGKPRSSYTPQQVEQFRRIRSKIRTETLETIEQDEEARRVMEAVVLDHQDHPIVTF